MPRTKILLVGWDAADWKVIHPLMDAGLMPHTRRLVENGVIGNLATLSPPLSPMMWTSIATGKRPFKHGILGFTEPTPDATAVRPISGLSRKTKAIWNILNQEGLRSLVIGWWPSHPAEPINGVMVSNHYQRAPKPVVPHWPMASGTVHPPELSERMAQLRLHPMEVGEEHLRAFVPHAEKVDQDKDRRLATVAQVIADCTTIHSCATHLLEHEPWDFAAVYYDAIDHFQHGFMKYHPPRQEAVSEQDFDLYKNVVCAGYVYHDMMLGRLVELAGEQATVIVVSDHGFHSDHLRPRAIPHEPAGPAIEHRDLGILVMAGPGIKQDAVVHGATLLDVTPTILALQGLPVGEDMDGRPLLDAFEAPPRVSTLASWDEVAGEDGRHSEGEGLDPAEAREALEQLIALGYIERPDEDHEKAVAKTRDELTYNLALSYIDAGMQPEALPLLAELYRDNPLQLRFGLQLALCLRALEMTEEMARVIDHLGRCWRRAAQMARERLKEISALARQRREEHKKSKQVSGVEQPRQPLFDDAERRVIQHLRSIARGNARTLDYLASNVAIARQDPSAALAHLEKAEESETRAPGFHLQLGNTYLQLKRYADAERCYRRVLELDPENPGGFLGLARSYLPRRRNRDALAAAQAAVGLKYHSPPAHFFLGVARHRLGELDAALDALQRAIAQNPNFAEAHRHLALIYGRRPGDATRARAHRLLAREIRKTQRRERTARRLPEIPMPDETILEGALPALPERKEGQLDPPLAAAPHRVDGQAAPERGEPFVTIVSGLPRAGTSMMMQMLAAGGVAVLGDGERRADENNPRGYFELEKVKQLATRNDWLAEASGKVVKVVAPLIPFLPQGRAYRVVFMHRELEEVIASQARMFGRLERSRGRLDDTQLRRILERQIEHAKRALAAHRVPVLEVSYAQAHREAAMTAGRVAEFLGFPLDQAAMQRAVAPDLYRERLARAEDAPW